MGKKSSQKSAKTRFYLYSHEHRDQKIGGKKARETIFPVTHNSASQKMLGKKSSQKSAKTRFLYSHEYRDQKMGGTKRSKHFFQQDTNSASKK